VTDPNGAGLGLRMESADGRAALTVAPRALGDLANLESMEVTFPALRSGPDGAAPPPERAPLRRGRLRTAVITVDEPRLAAALAPDTLAAFGIVDLRVRLGDGSVVLTARATRGGRQADFTARAVVRPASGRRARLEIDDVRLYGFLPVAAPLLGGALVAASAAGGGRIGAATPHWTVEIDALDLALYEIFAASGFRLPDVSGARLGAVAISPAGITLAWSGRPAAEAADITTTGAPRPLAEADGLLAVGETTKALDAYRAASGVSPEAKRRVLEILVSRSDALADAEREAQETTKPLDDAAGEPLAVVAALTRAAVASERGDAVGAARAYAAVASAADARGELDDARLARLAAAREWLRAHRTDEARPLLATLLAGDADDARAQALVAACDAEAPPPARAALVEPTPEAPPRTDIAATQAVTAVAVALAEAELAEATNRPDAAAEALRRAIDLLGEHDPARPDLARRLATVCERLGDEAGALVALRQFLDQADAGPAVAPAWRRIVELHARRGDPQAAARALIASADDARTGSTDEERGAALTAAAEILRKRLGLPGDAVMLLERAIALAPRASETLDALQTSAIEASNWERLADVLERKIDVVARGPVEQKDLLVQLAEVYDRQLHRAERARDTHERALGIDPAFRPSLTWLARDAWVRGDTPAAVRLYGQLAATETDEPRQTPDARAEPHVRLGTLARRAGDDGAAEREAERALGAMPDHPAALDLLIDLLEAQARHGELADALARRIATDLGQAARADLARRRAHALERAGRPLEAAALWRALVEHDAAALPALQRLTDAVRAADDPTTLYAVLEPLGEALVVTGDLSAAEQVAAARQQLAADPVAIGALAAERARLRVLLANAAGGDADMYFGALGVLREVAPETLPEEGLALLADLGERAASLDDALPALHELLRRARAVSHTGAITALEARIVDVTASLQPAAPATVEELERTLATDPADAAAAEGLAGLYAQISEPRARAEAMEGLLRRALGLPPDRRKAIYAVLGESAEASGDLERAEQAYWRAATSEAEPALRSNYLVSHARVLLARGEVKTAMSELEDAIARVPHHAGALALLADLTYRTQDWTRARQLYAELEAAPDAPLAIAREMLVYRRAVLADAQGDSADAESFYRELAILSPRHAEARRALADIALNRGDFGAAAVRLEEVLRLLPPNAIEALLDVRQRLGGVYVQLGDWGSARYYLELVLAQDPSRQTPLELLVDVYERLDLYREAAQSCARLSRLLADPTARAAALYRQGEIVRVQLGDPAGAFEVFLKSSDLDPQFPPTMVRLVSYFWVEGDFASLGDIAADLDAAGFSPDDDDELAVQLAIGTAIGPRARPPRWSLRGRAFDAVLAARVLAQVAASPGARVERIDMALDAVLEWAGPAPADAPLVPALADLVAYDPSDKGPLRALARHADRTGSQSVARATYALLAFADPDDDDGARRREALGVGAPGASAEALRVGGVADHPDAPAPLRRALAALATPLLGLPAASEAPPAAELTAERAADLARLVELLGAPACTPVADAGDAPAARITHAARPLPLALTPAALTLPDVDWTFLVARALEEARSGAVGLRALTTTERTEVLAGAQAALLGETPDGARAQEAARLVTEAGAALPTGDARARLVSDLRQVLSRPPDWEALAGAAAHTANRVGLLACGSPAAALAALAREDALLPSSGQDDTDDERSSFLRTSAVRELVRFMLSPACARVLDGSR
jgi:tetratricopeptide (TPR) repeat protein